VNVKTEEDGSFSVSGGRGAVYGSGQGGFGGHTTFDSQTGDVTRSGGLGTGSGGEPESNRGFHCESNDYTGEGSCVGKGFSGKGN
jgi:hypothetical protein